MPYEQDHRNHCRPGDRDLEIDAAEARLRAERRIGELIEEMPKSTGGKPTHTGVNRIPVQKTLSDHGIDKNLARAARTAASIPEGEFEEILEGHRAKGKPISSETIGKNARDKKKQAARTKAAKSAKLKAESIEGVYHGDFREIGESVPDNSAALIFTDPPYVKNGSPTKELTCMKDALRPLRRLYGHTMAGEFGPLALKAVRQHMIDANLSRGVINNRVNRIKRVFKWAVGEELIPPSVYEGLRSVVGLKYGRTQARETEPVRPVTMRLQRTIWNLNTACNYFLYQTIRRVLKLGRPNPQSVMNCSVTSNLCPHPMCDSVITSQREG